MAALVAALVLDIVAEEGQLDCNCDIRGYNCPAVPCSGVSTGRTEQLDRGRTFAS